MGRNGAGKSTLLRSLVGRSPILSGDVAILGKDPRELSSSELISAIGYVPQEAADLLIESSVEAECFRADEDNGLSKGVTWSIYNSLITSADKRVHPRDLSEGQKLSLVISILLSANPRILVLDEPTRGLDYAAKEKLVVILRGLAAEGRSILLATHDVELVAEVADRVVFIADGELISDGSAEQALTASPAFAPQVAKALPGKGVLTVSDVERAQSKK